MPWAASTRVHAQRLGAVLFDGELCGRRVEGDFAAEEIVRVEPSQYEVGIGDRGLRPALAITDWPGVGSGALGTDPQDAARIYPGDGPATCADFYEVDYWRADWISRAASRSDARLRRRPDLVVLGHAGCAALNQSGFGGRSAHVEGNHLVVAARLPQMRGCNHPGGWTGLDHVHRLLSRRREGVHSAAALHYE